MAKASRTIEEQITLLKNRNMLFRNEEEASHFLANISYYRLKGYWWEMQSDKVNHCFHDNSYFEDAIYLYDFDRHFRLILFSAIERIEIALRTKMIYHLSLSYGAYWYLEPSLFIDERRFEEFKAIISSELLKSREEFIIEHNSNYPNEDPESWKALEIITFGTLSKLYYNLNHQLPNKNLIAREFGLYNQSILRSWLLVTTLIRNIIAHHSRLWNRVIITKYDWPKNQLAPLLTYIPTNYQRGKIFPILSAIIYMNNFISPSHNIKGDLLALFDAFPKVQLDKMGFPRKWQNEPVWQ